MCLELLTDSRPILWLYLYTHTRWSIYFNNIYISGERWSWKNVNQLTAYNCKHHNITTMHMTIDVKQNMTWRRRNVIELSCHNTLFLRSWMLPLLVLWATSPWFCKPSQQYLHLLTLLSLPIHDSAITIKTEICL